MSREIPRSSIHDALRSSQYPVIFLTGDAGIGKSTLLREIETEIIAHGDAMVASVDCSVPVAGVDVGSVEALLPWVELMRSLAEPSSSSKKELITDLALAWIKFVPIVGDAIESTVATVKIVKEHRHGQQEPSSREHVFQQCVDFFAAVASQHRVVLMIDDAHWADDSSMNLLFTIARHRIPNLKLLIAYRPFDVKSSRNGSEHSLLRIRRELERYDLCTEVVVPPLTRDELEHIVNVRFGKGAGTAELVDRIERFSGGNPMLAKGFDPDGVLTTGSVSAVIHELISRIDGPLKELLMIASVEGEMFTSSVLAMLSGRGPLEIASGLRRAEQEYGVVRSLGKRTVYLVQTSAYEFSNDAIHGVLHAALGEEEREILHGMIANQIERERSTLDHDAVTWMSVSSRLAVHRAQSGDRVSASLAWLEVADRAWKLFAENESQRAIDQCLKELSVTGSSDTTKRVEAEAYDLRGRIAFFMHRIYDAQEAFANALYIYRELSATREIVLILCRMASIANVTGDPDRMKEYIDEALNLASKAGDDIGVLAATSVCGLWHETVGNIADALVAHQQARAMAERYGDDSRLGNALSNISRLLIQLNRYEEAKDLAQEAVVVFEKVHQWDRAARTLNNIGIASVHLHDLSGAATAYERALELHERIGDRVGASSLLTNHAQLEYERGNYDSALAMLNDSIRIKSELGERYGECIARYSKGLVFAALERRDDAINCLTEALSIAHEMREQLVIDEIEQAIQRVVA